ncbi:aldo/keto reductase [Haloferax denitrificans]|uniref:Putative NAD(P)H-dependent xylose reductase n=1 Tax=Haloferax denitrificans ATCC 35960 TaxID=662478 RepID=M0JFY3_9EURY|nr:aldo/keto reductase [Haloferax denitrificans]EMA06919.1 putative NAD(P)H-dependent xylose reductase [Haloferax denitrificans ATCC 35960]
MEYTTLGNTGLEVSRLALGCMSFGSSDWREWVLDEEESLEIIDRAIDLGINFFDNANLYSQGESERVLGKALDGRRDEMVVTTKCYYQMDEDDPNSQGLSRKAIEQELDNSLDRLGMDTVDIFMAHRWDYDTPIDVSLKAFDDAVRREKTRYIGTSSMWAHQFADALRTSSELDLERFEVMQNHYNLLYREEEREMYKLTEDKDVGVMTYSPLARGNLAMPFDEFEDTKRGNSDPWAHDYPYREGGGSEINRRVQELAAEKGVTMAQISLAWILHKEHVDVPIIGCNSIEHLEQSVAALDISLSDSDMEWLEEPYEPLPIAGHE